MVTLIKKRFWTENIRLYSYHLTKNTLTAPYSVFRVLDSQFVTEIIQNDFRDAFVRFNPNT